MYQCEIHFKTGAQGSSLANSGSNKGNRNPFILLNKVLKTEAGTPRTRAGCAKAG
jgi:hypothetical protein